MATPLTNAWIESLKQPCNPSSQSKKASKSSIYSIVSAKLAIVSSIFSIAAYKTWENSKACHMQFVPAGIFKFINQGFTTESNWQDFIPFNNLNLFFQKNLGDISLLSLVEPKALQNLKQEPASSIENDQEFRQSLKSFYTKSHQGLFEKITSWPSNTYAEASQDSIRSTCSAYEFWANATIITGGLLLISAVALPIIKKSYHYLFSR